MHKMYLYASQDYKGEQENCIALFPTHTQCLKHKKTNSSAKKLLYPHTHITCAVPYDEDALCALVQRRTRSV